MTCYKTKLKKQIPVGVAALMWALWLNRNDIVFNKAKPNTFLQVIFRMTYQIHTWSQLYKEDDVQANLKDGCRLLETVILKCFVKFGRRCSNRLEA